MKSITEYINSNQLNESMVALQLVGMVMGCAYLVKVLHDINMEKSETERDEFDAVEIVKNWIKDSKMVKILKKLSDDVVNKCAAEKDNTGVWKELESKLSKEEIDYMKSSI